VGQGRAPFASTCRQAEQPCDVRVETTGSPHHQLDATLYRGQQIVEVMGDPASKLTERLHFLRLGKGRLALL
jgi:hypothetical protein